MRYGSRYLIVLSCVLVLVTAAVRAADVDPFMGDWQGDWEVVDAGQSGPLAAQVIALGGGEYRIRLLESFTMVTDAYAVLDGRLQDGAVKFTGRLNPDSTTVIGDIALTLDKDRGTGRFQGDANGQDVKGSLSLKRTVRESPTLGAKPPVGAVVLLDGTNFDKWLSLGGPRGMINITEAVGNAQNAAAYLKAKIWSPKSQAATLLLGSDDGVKVWLNGKLIHANNALRGVSPDQDKAAFTLKEGTNELMLKVTNGASKEKDAVVTVVHNGVVIHNRLAIPHPTGGALDDRIAEPGPIYFQDHGNLVQFRNMWLVEQK
ncbi:MAG: DUF1080 domain-containing protein [Sedimentisphaerales bacterium]|nr:DUF1080 domain-containing protein [Sedimentisphaerales bacterium]